MPVLRWVGVVSLSWAVACSEGQPEDAPPASNEPTGPVTHSVAAEGAVSDVRAVFASGATRVAAVESVLRDVVPASTFALPASDASRFDVLEDDTIRLDSADASRIRSRVEVRLPLSADGEFELALAEPSMRVRVSLEGASGAVTAREAKGYVVYPDALGAGRHVLHRVVASGTEDYVLFPEAPSVPRLTYNIALDENTAGLRLVNNTLELLDDEGTPRLRVSPPYVATFDGRSEAATLSIEGCAYDTSPAAPWGRTPTLAGSDHCTVAVSWSATSYPLVVDPAWTDTGDMSVTRQEMDMVRLGGASSRVLVAGGGPFIGIGSSPLQSAELYDPSTGTWGATGAMTVGRADFTLTAIGPNEVLAVGGLREFTGFGTYEATSEIYNVTSGTWTQTADTLSEPRAVHAAARLASGHVLVTGGQSPSLMVGVELFDPADGSWTPRADMSVARRFHTASVVHSGGVEKVLVVGSEFGVLAAELYDPATDVWEATAPMAVPRGRHAATVLLDGTVLVTGGADGFLLRSLASAEVYDPDQDLWSSTANDMPVARQFHTATLRTDGSVLVAGGILQSATVPVAVLRASELYDVGTRSFTQAPSLTVARGHHNAVLLDDQNVLIAGGIGTSVAGDPYVILDPINVAPASTQASAELFSDSGGNGDPCAGDGDCVSGNCEIDICCPTGFGNCDGNAANGCESALDTVARCGACGNACSNANATPSCTAQPSDPDSPGGYECTLSCDPNFFDWDRDASNGCEATVPVFPLPQAVQNYLVEAVLWGRYSHGAKADSKEFRPSDGLKTRGVSRFYRNPAYPFVDICIVSTDPAIRAQAEPVLLEGVDTLSDHQLAANFLPPGCYTPQDQATYGPCLLDQTLVQQNPGRIYLFLDVPGQVGNACRSPVAYPAYEDYAIANGGQILGGILFGITPNSPVLIFSSTTLRHELAHMFGLGHTFGDPDLMSYRDRTTTFAPHELLALSVLNQLPAGLGLSDLIQLGLIEDSPAVLREPPRSDYAEVHTSSLTGRVFSDETLRVQNSAYVDEAIVLWGERQTLPLASEFEASVEGSRLRPFAYAPPILSFGSVSVVARLDYAFQFMQASSAGQPVSPFGNMNAVPTGRLRALVPAGTGSMLSGPLTLERYDGLVSQLSAFSVDDAVAPLPASTPLAASLTCTPSGASGTQLSWTLPSTFLDGTTALDPSTTTVQVFCNGSPLIELPGTTTQHLDTTVSHPRERTLYQVFLVNDATSQVGVPSNICDLAPAASGVELTLFLLDTSASMATLRADGVTRFQAMLGDLPPGYPGRARALAQLDEVFSGPVSPSVAVWSFDDARGRVDHVRALTGSTFTSNKAVALAALLQVRDLGPLGNSPLLDNICGGTDFILDAFADVSNQGSYATVRIFTDGGETASSGAAPCPSSCAAVNGIAPWDQDCRIPECGAISTDCTPCQVELFNRMCNTPITDWERLTLFVNYFGFGGPFSPLPPDSGYFLDLARASGGLFVHDGDNGTHAVGHLADDRPPTALPGDNQEIECTGPEGATVTLSGYGLDEDPISELTFEWSGPFGTADGLSANVALPLGSNAVTLVVSDEHQISDPASTIVTVTDTVAPSLHVTLSVERIERPNRAWVPVSAAVDVDDTCDPDVSVRLVSVEIDDIGVTGSRPDVQGAEFGTDDLDFEVRATRQGAGSGRTYVVTYEAEDAAGNVTSADATIFVPHDRR